MTTDAPPDSVPRHIEAPDVRNGIAFAAAAIVFVFVVGTGLVIWAAASLDGGVPGVTAPARHRPNQQDPPAAPRTIQPGENSASTSNQGQPLIRAPEAAQTVPLAGSRSGTGGGPTEAELANVVFPLDCPGVGTRTRGVLTDPTGPTVVRVECAAGSGSPPAALLAYVDADTGPPRLVATLLDTDEGLLVSDVTRSGDTITASTLSWSVPDGPRCCPDVAGTLRWRLDPLGAQRI
ncbi:hypothetical protein [Embleya scabrispora]|uniref:hypothetical protein n=1 Tax=Embleya scabrispora TaxID=159449 RepID=UPI00131A170E|nr:hypothetical protein [Embleya scabrispora]MYS81835.1 hypothetical protein [Streptomyces sp. SID5474]